MPHFSKINRILFVHNSPARFVEIDRDLLRERWQVQEWYKGGLSANPLVLADAVRHCDLVFGWFASWHTLLPIWFAKLMGKPSVIVVGGYDVANMPEISYGNQRGGMKKRVSRIVMSLATAVSTVSRYSFEEILRNTNLPREKIELNYLGVPDPFAGLPDGPRENTVLTVGNVKESNLLRKGHENVVRTARQLPDLKFVLIGRWADRAIDRLTAISSANVSFPGWVQEKELLAYYRRAAIYVQASTHEAFGLSVAEAMLAGCIPVTTKAGALPEVVGDTGIFRPSHQPTDLAASIQTALSFGIDLRRKVRERILTEFPIEKRRQALFNLMSRLAKASGPFSDTVPGLT